jgi:hypothetical protein
MEILNKIIKKGFEYASGKWNNKPSNGSISLLKPFLIKEKIPNIENIYCGTINVNISPKLFEIKTPDYTVECKWHPNFPKETFWFIKVIIEYKKQKYSGYIMYPLQSEVKAHKTNDVIELLCEKINGIKYGENISLKFQENKIKLTK